MAIEKQELIQIALPPEMEDLLNDAVEEKNLYSTKTQMFIVSLQHLYQKFTTESPLFADMTIPKEILNQPDCVKKTSINLFREYVYMDHSLIRMFGARPCGKTSMVKLPVNLLSSISKRIVAQYQYDEISNRDLVKYALALYLYDVYLDMIGGIAHRFFSFSNYNIEKVCEYKDVLTPGILLSLLKPKDGVYIGIRGGKKFCVNGVSSQCPDDYIFGPYIRFISEKCPELYEAIKTSSPELCALVRKRCDIEINPDELDGIIKDAAFILFLELHSSDFNEHMVADDDQSKESEEKLFFGIDGDFKIVGDIDDGHSKMKQVLLKSDNKPLGM